MTENSLIANSHVGDRRFLNPVSPTLSDCDKMSLPFSARLV